MAGLLQEYSIENKKQHSIFLILYLGGLGAMFVTVLLIKDSTFIKIFKWVFMPYFIIVLSWFVIQLIKFKYFVDFQFKIKLKITKKR